MKGLRQGLLAAALAIALGATPGCVWLLGHGEVPQPEAPIELATREASVSAQGLTARVVFLGVGERLLTARNVIGRVGRVVNPYGADTLVFAVRVENRSAEPATLLAAEATLRRGDGPERPARTLEDYRKRWPTWAVTSAEQGADREVAYRHVLDTLLLERLVLPRRPAEGRLAFPLPGGAGPLTLTLPYKGGAEQRRGTLEARFDER